MKISELINVLQSYLEVEGDVDVMMHNSQETDRDGNVWLPFDRDDIYYERGAVRIW